MFLCKNMQNYLLIIHVTPSYMYLELTQLLVLTVLDVCEIASIQAAFSSRTF